MMVITFRAFAWLAVLAILILSLVPGEVRPSVLPGIYTEHFVAYAVAGSLLASGYLNSRSMLIIGIILTICAGALETAQLWIPGRLSRPTDFAVSALGAWIGLGLIWLLRWTYDRCALMAKQRIRPSSPSR